MNTELQAAETLALKALTWLAGRDDLMDVFMGSTGVAASDLRERADDPEFLVAVVDFILMDDAWITAFSNENELAPDALMQARSSLPGGAQTHWT